MHAVVIVTKFVRFCHISVNFPIYLQIYAANCKPLNASRDFECAVTTWGIGANIETKLVNAEGKVNWLYRCIKREEIL